MTAPKKPERGFDNAKLMGMAEPLMVRVEKVRGNQRQPIEIPAGRDGNAPGTGLSKDEILRLESWLVTDWTGGGYYMITVTDANGVSMAWEASYPPAQFPEKVPPALQGATVPPILSAPPMAIPQQPAPMVGMQAMPQQPAAVGQQQMRPIVGTGSPGFGLMPGYTYGQPGATYTPPVQQAQAPATTPIQPPPAWPGWGFGGFPFTGSAAPRRTEDEDHRSRALELQLTQEREERIKREAEAARERDAARHQQELEKLRVEMQRRDEDRQRELQRQQEERQREQQNNAFQQQMLAMQQQIAQLAEKLANPGKRADDVEQLLQREREERRRELERLEMERQRDRERMEQAAREERLQREMRESQQAMQQQLLALQANKSDPMIDFMRDAIRAQADSQKELARTLQDNQARMQTMPFEFAKLMKEASSAPDAMVATLSRSFGGILDTYDKVIQSVAQIQGQGQPSTGMAMLQEGLGRASELVQQYLQNQRQAAVVNARAQAAIADAQARAVAAQAAAASGQQLAGATPPPAAQPEQAPAAVVQFPQAAAPRKSNPDMGVPEAKPRQTSTASDVPTPPMPMSQQQQELAEQKIFGLAYEPIMQIRQQILAQKMVPAQAIETLLGALQKLEQAKLTGMKVEIPAMELFTSGQFADFVDCVLSAKVPAAFRDQCTQILYQVFAHNAQQAGDEGGDEDGDDEDGDEDGDDVPANGQAVKAITPAPARPTA